MPHDLNGNLIKIGDYVRTRPYNHPGEPLVVGRVKSWNSIEPGQDCSGQIVWAGLGGIEVDYFGAGESLLVCRGDGTIPDIADVLELNENSGEVLEVSTS